MIIMNTITLKDNELVIFCGPSSAGKSHFAHAHFAPTQCVSSDAFRLMIGDEDETLVIPEKLPNDGDYGRIDKIRYRNYQELSQDAFDLLKATIAKRAKHNRLTVVDATSLYMDDIESYAAIAKKHHIPISIVFFNIPIDTVLAFDEKRANPRGVTRIKKQHRLMKNLLGKKKRLQKLGIREIYELKTTDDVCVEIQRDKPVISLENGVDIVGDGHGLLQTRLDLLTKAGYQLGEDGLFRHPQGRKIIYLNDETSRGSLPDTRIPYGETPSIAMLIQMKRHVQEGLAYAVDSNHNYKIWRWLEGRNVTMNHGDEVVVEEFAQFERTHGTEKTQALKAELAIFLKELPTHLIVEDRGVERVVVTHAGIQDDMIGKFSPVIRDYCRFGPTDGFDQTGKPKRLNWTKDHKNGQLIVWGHEPHHEVAIHNDTINVDTGGFCGHYLTMLRYPEMDVIQEKVPQSFVADDDNPIAKQQAKRFDFPVLGHYQKGFEVQTAFGTIKANQHLVEAAIEFASTRMAPLEEVIYVPPTMSPTPKTSSLADYLEHPHEAFQYYKERGVEQVLLEKKHMGSRAYITLFRNKEVGMHYYNRPSLGSILSRNSAKFFKKEEEQIVLEKLRDDLQSYFNEHQTDMIVLDAEILPWNLKAKGLIANQYDLTANAAIHARKTHVERLQEFQTTRGVDVAEELTRAKEKLANAEQFHQAFTYYCWDNDVRKLEGVQIAPFHVLAFDHTSHFDKSHVWHMEQATKLSTLSDLIIPTEHRLVDLSDEEAIAAATQWWVEVTELGHEGLVMKPFDFVARDQQNQLIQPAIKIRGRKYLRIIYGMDYLEEANLATLKKRSTSRKMKNALQEFTLSMESITRFIEKKSIARIHECILAALSYENEKVDPRL